MSATKSTPLKQKPMQRLNAITGRWDTLIPREIPLHGMLKRHPNQVGHSTMEWTVDRTASLIAGLIAIAIMLAPLFML